VDEAGYMLKNRVVLDDGMLVIEVSGSGLDGGDLGAGFLLIWGGSRRCWIDGGVTRRMWRRIWF
jgi:hypothetical protein